MFRIDTLTKVLDLFGIGKHGFRDGNRALAVPATDFSASWCNSIQEEICNVIEAAGIALDENDRSQLLQAIQQMVIGAQKAVIISNATFEASVADGEAVRWDSANNRFDEAVADGSANSFAVGIADVTNSKVYLYGECPLFAGLTPGARYYLSGAVVGAVTTAAPADKVVVGIAKSATVMWIDVDASPTQQGVDTGAIVYFPKSTAPAGYVKANGALLSRTSYAALWAYAQASGNISATDGAWQVGMFSPGDGATTFRIPDLRGEFIRGWDDGRGVDSGRSIGTWQADDFKSHTHALSNTATAVWTSGGNNPSIVFQNAGSAVGSASINNTGGSETRGRNAAQLACIKY